MDMPIKKWAIQYVLMTLVLFIVFSAVQSMKGQELEYAVRFGALWAFISSTIFFATRVYYFRKNIACSVCNDLPANSSESAGGEQ